jgi:hypothetical protein
MSSTTGIMMNIGTGIGIIANTLIFLGIFLIGLYLIWPSERDKNYL